MKRTVKIIGIAGLALALVAFAGGCGVNDVEDMRVQTDLGESLQLASDGDIKGARQFADQAIAIEPDQLSTYVSTVKDTEDQTGLDIDSIMLSVSDYRTDEIYLQQAVKDFPTAYQPLDHLVYVQEMLGETAAAQQTAKSLEGLLEARIFKGNLDGTALRTLGDACWAAGDHAKSATYYQRAMTNFPTNYVVYNDAAYQYAVANDVPNLKQAESEATIAITKARQQQKSDELIAGLQDTLGWVQYRMGDCKDALANVQQGVNSDERAPECRYHLAMVYQAMGDKPAAKAELDRTLKLAPDYAEAKAAAAQLKDVPLPPPLTVADVVNPSHGDMPGYPGLQPSPTPEASTTH